MNGTKGSSPPEGTGRASTWSLVKRLLELAWHYRWGCVKVLSFQVVLLTLGLLGLGLMGVGVDYIRYQVALSAQNGIHVAAGEVAAPATTREGARLHLTPTHLPKPPKWPLGVHPPDDWQPMQVLAGVAIAILLFALVRSLLNFSYTIAVNRLVQGQIVVDLRTRVYDKLQRLSFRFFDDNASGSLINRVTGDVQNVRSFVDGVLIQSVILLLSLIVYLVYMVSIHPGLTLACLAATPMLWFTTTRFSRTVHPAYYRDRELFDTQVLALTENFQGAQVVKGFARQAEEIAKFEAASRAVRDQKHWIFRKVTVFQPFIGFLTQINLIILLGYGGLLVVCYETAGTPEEAVRSGLSIGQLLVFTGLLQQFSGQVANIANIANSMQQSLTAAERVFEVLDTPVEITSPPDPVPLPRARGDIAFEQVCFSYDPGENVLEDVSFKVDAGQLVAILGTTGSGKSTLLSLVPRFYDPTRGRVLIDGTDVRRLDVEDLRRNIGVVFQESFLFSNSVAANIAFGHMGATMDQIVQAAKIAAAHDFIMDLPNRYDTILRQGGSELSGGQRQRIAIARALLLQPPILLLDDPTAAIDPETEDEILMAMDRAMEGRTTFIVAHRLSTLRRADLVIVLDKGRVVQVGTHEELMSEKGHYRRAAKLQEPDAESLRLLEEVDDGTA